MTERITPRGLEIKCDCKGCKHYIIGDADMFMKKYTRQYAERIGFVKKGSYWLCKYHTDLTEEYLYAQYEKVEEYE